MKYIYNIPYLLIFSFLISFEPTTINGKVVDENNNPIEHVFVSSKTDQYYTDSNGYFILLFELNDEIHFKKIGYSDIKVSYDNLNDLEVTMIKENLKLSEVTITEISGNVVS